MPGEYILVADDDPNILALVADTLEAKGYIVHRAPNGGEALNRLTDPTYVLLITDVQMPQMNGVEVVQQLRNRGSKIPVVMMSSMATGLTKDRAARLGSLVFLDKPFDPGALPGLVAEMLDTKRPLLSRNRRVLVADDHPETLRLLSGVLSAAGYEVICASDGQEATDRLKEATVPFDLAMIDIVMPKRAGPEVIAEIRQRSPKTLPILMSGEATSSEVGAGYEKGAYTFIRKPFEIDGLLRFLGKMEEQSDALRAEVEEREAEARRPLPVRAFKWFRRALNPPSSSPAQRRLQTATIILVSVVLALFVIWTAGKIESAVSGRIGHIESFMDRVEGYLQRDEAREIDGNRPR